LGFFSGILIPILLRSRFEEGVGDIIFFPKIVSFFSILSQPGRYKNGGHSKITLTKKRWVSGHKVSNFFQHQGRLKNVNIGVGRWLKKRDQKLFNVVSE